MFSNHIRIKLVVCETKTTPKSIKILLISYGIPIGSFFFYLESFWMLFKLWKIDLIDSYLTRLLNEMFSFFSVEILLFKQTIEYCNLFLTIHKSIDRCSGLRRFVSFLFSLWIQFVQSKPLTPWLMRFDMLSVRNT